MAKFCGHCGAPVSEDARVCNQCGQSLIAADASLKQGQVNSENTKNRKSIKKKGGIIIAVLLVMVAGIVGWLMISGHSSCESVLEDAMVALEAEDVDALTALSSDVHHQRDMGEATDYFRQVVKQYHLIYGLELGDSFTTSYEVKNLYEPADSMASSFCNRIKMESASFDLKNIKDMRVAEVLLEGSNEVGDSSARVYTIVMTQERKGWRVLYIAESMSAIFL